jgi:hypothetical protein
MKFLGLLFVISFSCAVYGQDAPSLQKQQAFIIPSEVILPVVASQPGCPLRFENVRSIFYIDRSGTAETFDLRNVGGKPIRDFTVAGYTSYGGMWSKSRPQSELQRLVLTGEAASVGGEEEVEIIPLNDKLRTKFKVTDRPMGGVVVLIVVRVEFADGSVFSDEKTSKALEAYFKKLGEYQ